MTSPFATIDVWDQLPVGIQRRVIAKATRMVRKVEVLDTATSDRDRIPPVPAGSPDFVQRVTAMMIAGKGDLLPVSAMPVDGTFPTATARYEKRNIAAQIPIWDEDLCIECGLCALVCPHAAIRTKRFSPRRPRRRTPVSSRLPKTFCTVQRGRDEGSPIRHAGPVKTGACQALMDLAQREIDDTWHDYEQLAGVQREFSDASDESRPINA